MDIISTIAGLISDAPEAIDLWNKIAPILRVKWFVPASVIADIEQSTPAAQAAAAQSRVKRY